MRASRFEIYLPPDETKQSPYLTQVLQSLQTRNFPPHYGDLVRATHVPLTHPEAMSIFDGDKLIPLPRYLCYRDTGQPDSKKRSKIYRRVSVKFPRDIFHHAIPNEFILDRSFGWNYFKKSLKNNAWAPTKIQERIYFDHRPFIGEMVKNLVWHPYEANTENSGIWVETHFDHAPRCLGVLLEYFPKVLSALITSYAATRYRLDMRIKIPLECYQHPERIREYFQGLLESHSAYEQIYFNRWSSDGNETHLLGTLMEDE